MIRTRILLQGMKSIFAVLKLVLNDSLPVYFRRIYYSGYDRVPEEGPVIYACNHPNSFMDALVIGQYSSRAVHFLARGDVFNSPFKRFVLGQMHMMPIFRLEEGAENLAKNEETFKFSREVLRDNGTILIFSEGICVLEKRLRKLRKGTARLAFDAEASSGFSLGLKVVPVGTNYTYPTAFRGEVMTTFGEPIAMADYADLYAESPAKAIQAFNQELSTRLAKYIVHINHPEEENLVEALHRIMRSGRTEPVFGGLIFNSSDRVLAEMAVAQKVNDWYDNDRTRFDALNPLGKEYLALLDQHRISDSTVKREGEITRHRWIYQVLGWPVFRIGLYRKYIAAVMGEPHRA